MTTRRRDFLRSASALTALCASGISGAQPALFEQARILVGFPPGGGTDGAARRVAEGIRGHYAGIVVVDNKPGAAGRLAVEEVRRSVADGSLMLMQPDAVMTQQPHVDPKNTRYKFDDLSPVASMGLHHHALVVGPMVPETVRSVRDFLEWAKAHPKQAAFGTAGANSSQDILMRIAMKQNGFELTHVPYRGSIPGIQDALAGQVAAMFSPVGDSLQYRPSGKLRAIGTSGSRRSKFMPDVPTFEEQGIKGMELTERMGLWVRRGVPDAVQDKLHTDVKRVLQLPEVIEFLARSGFEPDPISRREYTTALQESFGAWGERVRLSGFKPES